MGPCLKYTGEKPPRPSWICCLPLPQCLSTQASLTRKACLCTNELFRATHNTVTVLDASIHWASLPMTKARAEPSWKTETRTWTSPLVSDLSDRGIPKALRIVANVLTPPGDLSAGIKRRQLFHFVGIDVEIERSKTYHFSLVLLRDRVVSRKQPVSSWTSSKTL